MRDFTPYLRASTPEDREAAFQVYLENSVPYFEVVEAAGDKPWFNSVDERRERFMRRYRPIRSGASFDAAMPIITPATQENAAA
jgi:hypothetical protein